MLNVNRTDINPIKYNIKFIIILLLLSLLKLSLLTKIVRKKLKKRGIYLSIIKPNLKAFQFTASSIYIRTDRYTAILRNLRIKFSVRFFFSFKWRHVKKTSLGSMHLTLAKVVATSRNFTKSFKQNEKISRISKILRKLFNFSIGQSCITIGSLQINSITEKYPFIIKLSSVTVQENTIQGKVKFHLNDFIICTNIHVEKSEYFIKIHEDKHSNFIIKHSDTNILSISHFQVNIIYSKDEEVNFTGKLEELNVNHRMIADHSVFLKYVSFEIPVFTNKNGFKISGDSNIDFNGIESSFELVFKYDDLDSIACSVLLLIEGKTFFNTYPFFSIKELTQIKASGAILIKLNYITLASDLSKYNFTVNILEDTLSLNDTSAFDLLYLETDFITKTVAGNEKNNRVIEISSSNPHYLGLDAIPKICLNTILLAEDPNFFNHKGIDSNFLGLAIATNIFNKRFQKGGSTITMQLVRNLFLSHSKNIVRKLDELVITWLIETHYNLSKKRILEIYLNVIEFGDNIYGLSEASLFYFEKSIGDLSITEFIVLSYIIPRPKYFLNAVRVKSPQLIQNLKKHIFYYSSALLKNNIIDKDTYSKIEYTINFRATIGPISLQ